MESPAKSSVKVLDQSVNKASEYEYYEEYDPEDDTFQSKLKKKNKEMMK